MCGSPKSAINQTFIDGDRQALFETPCKEEKSALNQSMSVSSKKKQRANRTMRETRAKSRNYSRYSDKVAGEVELVSDKNEDQNY